MRVLLIQPKTPYISEAVPLGLGYIAAELKKDGHETKILDATAAYANYTNQDIIEFAKKYSPNVIGVSIMTSNTKSSYKLIKDLKKLKIPIIGGGAHSTLMPEEVLNNGTDIAVVGEAEITLKELLKKLEKKKSLKGVKGISYKLKNKIIHNPPRKSIEDLDKLSFPDKDAFILKDFAKNKKELSYVMGTIITSRGCVFKCTFCSQAIFGNKFRFRSAKNIVKEMDHLNKKYGCEYFFLVDDTININYKRMIDLCELLKNKDYLWRSVLRLDLVTKELLKKMKESGCTEIAYGIESGDNYSLRMMQKNFTIEKAKQVVKWTHEAGIKQTLNYMFGFPWETPKQIESTIKVIKELAPYTDDIERGSILTPMPKTKLYDDYLDQGNYKNWWLHPDKYLKGMQSMDAYQPLYKKALFQDIGHLDKDGCFFKYPKPVIKKIRKAMRIINNVIIKNKAKKMDSSNKKYLVPFYEILIKNVFFMSKLFYTINPKLEKLILHDSYYWARRKNLVR